MWFQNVYKKTIKSAVLHRWLIAIAKEMSKPVKPFLIWLYQLALLFSLFPSQVTATYNILLQINCLPIIYAYTSLDCLAIRFWASESSSSEITCKILNDMPNMLNC